MSWLEQRFFGKEDPGSQFQEIDFYKMLCNDVFDGRFHTPQTTKWSQWDDHLFYVVD